ncbi:MAG: hypothetical protein JWM07_836, partial [Candidatus Saccharibacteria bacterium]|nr:hypothetical protein [Candidatus Saccharibacteria bacterium]
MPVVGIEPPNSFAKAKVGEFVKCRATKLACSFCQQAEIGNVVTAVPPSIIALHSYNIYSANIDFPYLLCYYDSIVTPMTNEFVFAHPQRQVWIDKMPTSKSEAVAAAQARDEGPYDELCQRVEEAISTQMGVSTTITVPTSEIPYHIVQRVVQTYEAHEWKCDFHSDQ